MDPAEDDATVTFGSVHPSRQGKTHACHAISFDNTNTRGYVWHRELLHVVDAPSPREGKELDYLDWSGVTEVLAKAYVLALFRQHQVAYEKRA